MPSFKGNLLTQRHPGVSIWPGFDSVPGRDTPDRQADGPQFTESNYSCKKMQRTANRRSAPCRGILAMTRHQRQPSCHHPAVDTTDQSWTANWTRRGPAYDHHRPTSTLAPSFSTTTYTPTGGKRHVTRPANDGQAVDTTDQSSKQTGHIMVFARILITNEKTRVF